MDATHQKFHDAVRRREQLKSKRDQLVGKLESARARYAEVCDKCRGRGIDPDKIDEFIEKVRKVYVQKVDEVSAQVAEAEAKLLPYLNM